MGNKKQSTTIKGNMVTFNNLVDSKTKKKVKTPLPSTKSARKQVEAAGRAGRKSAQRFLRQQKSST